MNPNESAPEPPVRPPPIPGPPPAPGGSAFEDDYRAFDPALDPRRLVDRLLRRPGQIAFEIAEGRHAAVPAKLLLLVAAGFGAYGLLVGSFSGHAQYWLVPLKICGGLVLSAVLCLPSLYIFACLAGGGLSLSRTGGLLLQALALAGVLLCGFLPVAWLFSQSTHSIAFMAVLHWAVWLVCAAVGLQVLRRAVLRQTRSGGGLVKTWAVVFLLVVFQMATFLRPLVGPAPDGLRLEPEKMNFLQHWGATILAGGP